MDLNQVTIEANDFAESVDFFAKIGLRLIVSERGEYAHFELPSGSATFSIHHSDQVLVSNIVLYFEVDDVDRKHSELEKLGVKFETSPKTQHWRWREARFSDPSGNKLCIFHAGPDRRFPPWRLDDDVEANNV